MSMFRTNRWHMLLLIGISSIAGCEHMPADQKVKTQPAVVIPNTATGLPDCIEARQDVLYVAQARPVEDLERILAYNDLLNRLTPKQLNQEYKVTKDRLTKNPADTVERFRLILLLINAKGDRKDYKSALSLLDEYFEKHKDNNQALNSFAGFLKIIVKEQISLAEQESVLEKRIQTSEKNAKTLQEQLDALKSIETSIHRRDIVEGQQQ